MDHPKPARHFRHIDHSPRIGPVSDGDLHDTRSNALQRLGDIRLAAFYRDRQRRVDPILHGCRNDSNTFRAALIQPTGLVSWRMLSMLTTPVNNRPNNG